MNDAVFPDIDAEKGQQALRQGIEGFNPSALKKTETHEKNVLPTKESKCISMISKPFPNILLKTIKSFCFEM